MVNRLDRFFPFLLVLLFLILVIIGLNTSDFILQVGLFALFGYILQWWMKKRKKENIET
jgi:hypothetical protein